MLKTQVNGPLPQRGGGEDIFLYTCMDSVHFDLIVHSLMFFIAF